LSFIRTGVAWEQKPQLPEALVSFSIQSRTDPRNRRGPIEVLLPKSAKPIFSFNEFCEEAGPQEIFFESPERRGPAWIRLEWVRAAGGRPRSATLSMRTIPPCGMYCTMGRHEEFASLWVLMGYLASAGLLTVPLCAAQDIEMRVSGKSYGLHRAYWASPSPDLPWGVYLARSASRRPAVERMADEAYDLVYQTVT
jgi:hypothetical protein